MQPTVLDMMPPALVRPFYNPAGQTSTETVPRESNVQTTESNSNVPLEGVARVTGAITFGYTAGFVLGAYVGYRIVKKMARR